MILQAWVSDVSMERTILHCDLNSFYASVECVKNPALKDVPMAVAGDPKSRHGIILAKNELAKGFGVKTAETIWQARKKCPDLVLVPPCHKDYSYYSRLAGQIYEEFTDLVEPFGIDESWLDVTGVQNLFGSGEEIANKIRQALSSRLGLTASVGVSFNKIFAKLGSDYKKPDATTIITLENYHKIVHPLPVTDLLYVGSAANEALSKMHIKTIGELARSNKSIIIKQLGKIGEVIHDYANGLDDSPVKSAYEQDKLKSIGNGMTFRRNLASYDDILTGVAALSDEVCGRMRKHGVKCGTISVAIKDPDFKTVSKQKTLESSTNLTKEVIQVSMDLVKLIWNKKAPIRSITITGSHIVDAHTATEQLSLFEESKPINKDKQERLENTVHKIREKYGKSSIELGSIINNDII
ncbi:MAG: DNA polymerase IV [Defluviitaleaceae bacterium]|nr:DNA polymerase IV [Defluviitaleaceae bacterium]